MSPRLHLESLEARDVPATFTPFPGSPVAVGVSPGGVTAADFDGDGDLDLANANFGSSTASVLLNNGSGSFTNSTGSPFAVGTNPVSITSADLDGDGDIDLATCNYISDNVSILLNNGSGTFTAGTPVAAGNGPREIVSADLDGDGDRDIAVTNYSSDNVSILRNNGNATFTVTSVAVGTRPRGLAMGDLDGDGDADLVSANYLANTVSVLLNNGSASFTDATGSPITVGTRPTAIAIADLDGDGDRDVAVTNNTNNNASILLNNGDATFTAGTAATTGVGPRGITAADIDGDGDNDLIVDNFGANTVGVLLNNGNATFIADTPLATNNNPYAVKTADLNGDGKLDIVTSNSGNSSLSLFQNTTVTTADVQVTATGPVSATVGSTVTYTVTVTNAGPQGAGSVGFTIPVPAGLSGVTFTSAVTGGASGNTASGSGAIADTLTLPSGSTVTYTVTGTVSAGVGGSVVVTAVATPPSGVTDPTPGDASATATTTIVSQPGVLQLTAIGSGAGAPARVNVYSPDGSVRVMQPFAGFRGGVTVATGDVNGDGVTDIITGAGPGGAPIVAVYSGTDLSLLGAFLPYTLGFRGGVTVASGDMNGDGRTDIIVGAGPGGAPIVAVFNGTDLSLQSAFLAFGSDFRGGVTVASGDVNGDGRTDVIAGAGPGGAPVVAVYSGTNLSLLGAFLPYPLGFRGGVTVASGDVNGDGRTDIIVGAGPGGAPIMAVYSGTDLSLLGASFAFDPAFRGGVTVASRDVNGDGRTDIIAGAGPGGAPIVAIYSGTDLSLLSAFFAFDLGFRGGVFVG